MSPEEFQRNLRIPCVGKGRVFGSVMADFQRDRFALVNPALESISRGDVPSGQRFWWEATKGASKDSDLAVCLLWLCVFSQRSLMMQVGAADRDQAAEMRKAAADILRLNPGLKEMVKIENWRILGLKNDVECEVISADVSGSHGARPDVLVLNELSHVTKREYAENLLDNASKVPHGLVVVATNAGHLGTWQHEWRQMALESDRWSVHIRNTPSPWLDEGEIKEAMRRNSRSRFLRLWNGVWGTGEDGALSPEDLEACVSLEGVTDERGKLDLVIGGLDLGVKKDHAALVIMGVDAKAERYRLMDCISWKPPIGGQVDLSQVEHACRMAKQRYALEGIAFDPNQALYMAQRLVMDGVRMMEMPFTGPNCDLMARTLIDLFTRRRIDLYREKQLIRDLLRLEIVERTAGYRIKAIVDEQGHCDRGIAMSLVLPYCVAWREELFDVVPRGTEVVRT